jgi:hypothetical protein
MESQTHGESQTIKALMCLPNAPELESTPDGFSRKEWDHRGDHFLFVQVKSGPLKHIAMIECTRRPHFWCSQFGSYELFVHVPMFVHVTSVWGCSKE